MDSLLTRLQRALAGRYTVEHELGRGGMAVVFLGHDQRLERRVAIKVFEKEGGLISAGERFLREIRIAAKLQHPNILPVFESGEGEHLIYYVMPYVAGGSVRERLEREGPFPIPDAVRIAREVAEALDHAHRAGIVHRDIKPDNIMLADGVAVVADFGIARALEQGGGGVTDTGLAIGTPNYMSPEQASASPQVDGRTDIYALGCVLYEMLAGTPPFSGTTAQQVMARHATDRAPPLSTVRKVEPVLEQTIVKALAKLPGDRWSTGRAFAEALASAKTAASATVPRAAAKRHLQWLGAAAVLTLVVYLLAQSPPSSSPGSNASASDSVVMVAVLPLVGSGDSGSVDLAFGLTDGLTTGLVRIKGLGVVAGVRTEAYRDSLVDPGEIGRRLEVGAVLTGKVRFQGNRIRVTPQLTDVATGRLLWQDEFDGELVIDGKLQDLFVIQDAMTSQIVAALLPTLAADRSATSSPSRVPTQSPEAYGLYLAAKRVFTERTPAALRRATALLEEALRRDSTFADAWVALSDVKRHLGAFELLAQRSFRQPLDKALSLDPDNAYALATRGILRAEYDWDWDGALRDLRRAVKLAPASSEVAGRYSYILNMTGQRDSGLAERRRAVRLDPADSRLWSLLGTDLYVAGLPDSALAASAKALELDSAQWTTYHTRMHLYFERGRRAEADSAAARYLRLGGELWAQALGYAAVYYRRSGNRAAAQEILDRLNRLPPHQVAPSDFAAARLAIGDRAGALAAVEQAVAEHDVLLPQALLMSLRPLYGDPRFEVVRRRVFGANPPPPEPIP